MCEQPKRTCALSIGCSSAMYGGHMKRAVWGTSWNAGSISRTQSSARTFIANAWNSSVLTRKLHDSS